MSYSPSNIALVHVNDSINEMNVALLCSCLQGDDYAFISIGKKEMRVLFITKKKNVKKRSRSCEKSSQLLWTINLAKEM